MDFSVIIPAYNEEKYLPATLIALTKAIDSAGVYWIRSTGNEVVKVDLSIELGDNICRAF